MNAYPDPQNPDRPWPIPMPPRPSFARPGDDDMPRPNPNPAPSPRPGPFRLSAHKQASPSAPTGAVLAVHPGPGALRRSRRPVTPLTPAA